MDLLLLSHQPPPATPHTHTLSWYTLSPSCPPGEVLAVRNECEVGPAAATPSTDSSADPMAVAPLLLLDLLQLDLGSSSSAQDGRGGGRGGGRGLGLGSSNGNGALYSDDEDGGDEEEEEEDVLLRLWERMQHDTPSKLRLFVAAGAPQQLWAVHRRGCWNVNVCWMPQLARALVQVLGGEGGWPGRACLLCPSLCWCGGGGDFMCTMLPCIVHLHAP